MSIDIEKIAPGAVTHRQLPNEEIVYVYPMLFQKFRLMYGNIMGTKDQW